MRPDKAGEPPLTQEEIRAGLVDVGLRPGDTVLVHSSMRKLGRVDGGADTVLGALLDVLRSSGNLVLPTFNYGRPLPSPWYDPAVTPARTGIIPEVGRHLPGAVRSLSPTHSVAVIGPRSLSITGDHLGFRTFGPGSPIDRVARDGGKVLLVGVDQTTNSAIHVAEEYAGIPKASWYPELPWVRVRMPDGTLVDHRLDDSASCSGAFNAVEGELRRHDEIADGRIRACRIQLIDAASVVARAIALIETKPDILLCRWRGCRPCVGARDRLRTEGRHPSV
jgi:aminoglycoside 3-N-acetyltransferase